MKKFCVKVGNVEIKSARSDELEFEMGGGCIWHEEQIPVGVRLRVLKEIVAKWEVEKSQEFDHDWIDQLDTAIGYLSYEIESLESSKT